jgi:hypothetical protein
MQRRDLARYHNVAASSKTRGEGIGFAGVGIKLGLLVADEVVTETRRGKTHVATTWHLASKLPRALEVDPAARADRRARHRGAARLANPLSPLLDAGYLEEAIRHHFAPLLDPAFDELLRRHYPDGLVFEVDGQPVRPAAAAARERVTIPIRLGRKRLPSAIAVLERHTVPLPDDQHGIAISTFGKVIKGAGTGSGSPPAPFRISGVVEAPDLAACLTLSKNDFIRTGRAWRHVPRLPQGDPGGRVAPAHAVGGRAGRRGAAAHVRLERDLARVLEDLADDFPLLRSLVDQRPGGQKRLPLPGRGDDRVPGPLFARGRRPGWGRSTPNGADGRGAGAGLRGEPPTEPPSPGRNPGGAGLRRRGGPPCASARCPSRPDRHTRRQGGTGSRLVGVLSAPWPGAAGPGATGCSCSSSHAPATRSSGGSWTARSGSTRRIRPTSARPPRARPAITSR